MRAAYEFVLDPVLTFREAHWLLQSEINLPAEESVLLVSFRSMRTLFWEILIGMNNLCHILEDLRAANNKYDIDGLLRIIAQIDRQAQERATNSRQQAL